MARALSKRTPRPPKVLGDSAGNPVHAATAAARRWLEHFSGAHSGTEVSLVSLLESQRPEVLRPRTD
eukprot:9658907-Alexandrium_andersonii.AAC.1